MDIEPLTGGCHFNNGCMQFTQSCGDCPQLVKGRGGDISRRIWVKKKKDFADIPIVFIAVSSWVLDHIKRSSLFGYNQTENICLGVDQNIFTKVDKETARSILQLPKNKKIILFGAFNLNDERKGSRFLLSSLKKLSELVGSDNKKLCDSVLLLTIGRKNGFKSDGIPFDWIHLGEIRDDRILSLIYQASDVMASLSVDDFGPMMINEAFMCRTPVVAFRLGVAPDLIKSQQAGYIAKKFDTDEFASGLVQCLFQKEETEDNQVIQELRKNCRPDHQAMQYSILFQELISKGGG
jgi:glycosyltransferase involved in cell wall biosynthesis